MKNSIKIFDTTLRDGEQSPGCSMSIDEKVKIAKQLEKLNVDIIEAGFAISSKGDFDAIVEISKVIKKCTIASLCRASIGDIDAAWNAIKNAKHPRIHTFIATSDIHLKYKLKKSREEILAITKKMVSYAKSKCEDVEFSAEDATRSDRKFLVKIFETAIKSGATVINVPDTVGYALPSEFANLIGYLKANIRNIDQAEISVHCHNDLGLAVANSLSSISQGATQVECTINGIGERAGNAALEEVAMCINTRKELLKSSTNLDYSEIYRSSKMVSSITGSRVQANKAIVGKNAFAHEAGIHQHGVLANTLTYEIMTPQSIGLNRNNLVLGKHSGKHAFKDRLKSMGYTLKEGKIEKLFVKFKELADMKKEVTQADLESLVEVDFTRTIDESFELLSYSCISGSDTTPLVKIKLKDKNGEVTEKESTGDGLVDSAFKVIEKISKTNCILKDYVVSSVGKGKDAQGKVMLKIQCSGEKRITKGLGLSTDVVEASIKAYLNAINKLLLFKD